MPRRIIGALVGAILYIFLGWVTAVGPFMSGLAAGLVAGRGVRRGFLTGFASAILGAASVLALMAQMGLRVDSVSDALLLWVFLVHSLLGFAASAAGGGVGAMLPTQQPRPARKTKPASWSQERVYVICPTCGHSNIEEDESCRSCGKRIKD